MTVEEYAKKIIAIDNEWYAEVEENSANTPKVRKLHDKLVYVWACVKDAGFTGRQVYDEINRLDEEETA